MSFSMAKLRYFDIFWFFCLLLFAYIVVIETRKYWRYASVECFGCGARINGGDHVAVGD